MEGEKHKPFVFPFFSIFFLLYIFPACFLWKFQSKSRRSMCLELVYRYLSKSWLPFLEWKCRMQFFRGIAWRSKAPLRAAAALIISSVNFVNNVPCMLFSAQFFLWIYFHIFYIPPPDSSSSAFLTKRRFYKLTEKKFPRNRLHAQWLSSSK